MKDPLYGRIPYNLMIVRMSSLGDIIHTLPAYNALHEKFPETKLHWLIDEPYKDIVDNLDGVEAECLNRPEITHKLKTLEGFWMAIGLLIAFMKHLRKLKLVASIIFQPLLRTALLTRLSGSRVRLGFKRFAEAGWFFLTHRNKVSKKQHAIEQNMELIAPIGVDTKPKRIPIKISNANQKFVDNFLSDYKLTEKKFITICPSASKPYKQWTSKGYAELADQIAAEHNLTPVLACLGDEIGCVKEIVSHMKSKYIVAHNFNLQQLAALLKMSVYTVAPDTGPLHLAAAMGTPVVGIYGPTDPTIFGPYWDPNRVVVATLKCRKKCARKHKKSSEPCTCMKEIECHQVFASCNSIYDQINKDNSD